MANDRNRLTQQECAEWLLLTSRQVHNLVVEKGLPRQTKGGKAFYRWPDVFRWWNEYKAEQIRAEIERRTPSSTLEARQLEAETRLQEIRLAKEEASLVSIDYLERQLTAILEVIRAHLLNAPGKFAPAMVGLRTIADAQERLVAMIAEVMGAMQEIGEDPDLDVEPVEDVAAS